jgi:hypothetical protein
VSLASGSLIDGGADGGMSGADVCNLRFDVPNVSDKSVERDTYSEFAVKI